jgi:hypothetical protein|tara:strand:- start:288 stop:944 length:657 start_codon:yes stop_codon:yes gene_type:complete
MKEAVEDRFIWKKLIDSVISMHSGEPFKSGSKTASVIAVETNPESGRTAFRLKDNTLVDCYKCRPETVVTILGEFKKMLVTTDFTFYCNVEEGDDDGNTFMFRNNPFGLVSNNMFASQGFLEALANEEIVWESDYLLNEKKIPEFMEMINYHKITTYKVSGIDYDTDGEDIPTLPKELEIIVHHSQYETQEEIEEYLSDQISEQTGFCHKGFTSLPKI